MQKQDDYEPYKATSNGREQIIKERKIRLRIQEAIQEEAKDEEVV